MNDPMPTMTAHAHVRWHERCPGLKWQYDWSVAARPTKRVLVRIREGLIPSPAGKRYTVTHGRIQYAYARKSGVVFVIDTEPHTCITVWRLDCKPARTFPPIKPKAKRPGIKVRIIEDSHP